MKLADDAAAELLLEGVDSQKILVVAPLVPTSEVEERNTGIPIAEMSSSMKVAIRPSDHVPCRRVAVLAEQRGRMQQACSVAGPHIGVPDQYVIVTTHHREVENARRRSVCRRSAETGSSCFPLANRSKNSMNSSTGSFRAGIHAVLLQLVVFRAAAPCSDITWRAPRRAPARSGEIDVDRVEVVATDAGHRTRSLEVPMMSTSNDAGSSSKKSSARR